MEKWQISGRKESHNHLFSATAPKKGKTCSERVKTFFSGTIFENNLKTHIKHTLKTSLRSNKNAQLIINILGQMSSWSSNGIFFSLRMNCTNKTWQTAAVKNVTKSPKCWYQPHGIRPFWLGFESSTNKDIFLKMPIL